MRIALLSNITADLLADTIRKTDEVYVPAGFDTWQQEIMTSNSGLYEFEPESVVVLIHVNAYIEIDRKLVDEWIGVIKFLADRLLSVPVFVSSIDVREQCVYGSKLKMAFELEDYYISAVQGLHSVGLPVYILPVKEAICEMGRNSFYSDKMWYMGSMPYSIKGLKVLSEMVRMFSSAAMGRRKKCFAVDLDNTLWGGTIGEDGADDIILSNHNEGARYYDTQRILRKMEKQGVMLAILSKNNPDDVETVFNHPYMLLQHENFVAEKINWESKSDNIRKLANELNIGLDAFVFLDDNPAEREQMRSECPEVAVIDFPKDTSQLPRVVEKAFQEYFFTLEVTAEDREKTTMYHADAERKHELESASSVEEYLSKLEMRLEIHFMKSEEERRVVQLINKTNQFNVTTKRYSEEQIKELAEDSDIITAYVADKYGDQGLVAVMILKYADRIADIDTFLMSCRVMGRRVENEIMTCLKGMLKQKSISKVKDSYIKTEKNKPVEKLFDGLGFVQVAGTPEKKVYAIAVEELPETTGIFISVTKEWE